MRMKNGFIEWYRTTDIAGALLVLLPCLVGLMLAVLALVHTLTGSVSPELSLQDKIDLLSPKDKVTVESYVDHLYYVHQDDVHQ